MGYMGYMITIYVIGLIIGLICWIGIKCWIDYKFNKI